jgi:quinoprotein glucose dehydrogenase
MTAPLISWRGRLIGTLFAAVALSGAGSPPVKGEWRYYAGDNASTKYSPLDQINRSNVSKLRVMWRRPQVDPDFAAAHPRLRLNNNYRSTPIMVDGLLYATNAVGVAEAFDPETGRTVWRQKTAEEITGNPGLGGALRAVAYWRAGADARIFTYQGRYLYALDP